MTEEELPAKLREVLKALRETARHYPDGVTVTAVERYYGRGEHVAAALSDLVRAGFARRVKADFGKFYLPVDR